MEEHEEAPRKKRRWSSKVGARRAKKSPVEKSSSAKRKYVKNRLSMPKKRHIQVADATQSFTITACDAGPSQELEKQEEQMELAGEGEGIMHPEVGTDLQELTDTTSAQPLMETSIYKDVVWSQPMETNLVFDSSFLAKETVDENEEAFHEMTPASHGANLKLL